MSEFEDEVKNQLSRLDAPEGFADRVIERIAKRRKADHVIPFSFPRTRAWWPALAALLLLGISVAIVHWEQVQRQRAVEVQQQFALAMRVTGRTLEVVDQRISRAGVKKVQ